MRSGSLLQWEYSSNKIFNYIQITPACLYERHAIYTLQSLCATAWRQRSERMRVCDDIRSYLSLRRRGEDSTSTEEMQLTPTWPRADLQNPDMQDTVFSSSHLMHSSILHLSFNANSPLTCGTSSSWEEGTLSCDVSGTSEAET
uniref:Uncharacterized protein n=1 Tax=Lynx canadensis TaxID=61383 RepID=A0A667GS34_LYNCA